MTRAKGLDNMSWESSMKDWAAPQESIPQEEDEEESEDKATGAETEGKNKRATQQTSDPSSYKGTSTPEASIPVLTHQSTPYPAVVFVHPPFHMPNIPYPYVSSQRADSTAARYVVPASCESTTPVVHEYGHLEQYDGWVSAGFFHRHVSSWRAGAACVRAPGARRNTNAGRITIPNRS